MPTTSLDAFADPRFTVVFENVGNALVHLNSRVIPNIRIYDEGGTLLVPPLSIICDCQSRPIAKNDLIQIAPRGSWTIALPPQYPSYGHTDAMSSYTVSRPGSEDGLLLPGGRYTARFTYVNFSGGLDRSVDACSRAVDALNSLTGQYLDFDFTLPMERQRALEAYSSASSR